jgi:hypothetical protein
MGVEDTVDVTPVRRARDTSIHLREAATTRAASSGEVDLVANCAAISSKLCNEEKIPLFVPSEDLSGSTGNAHIVSCAYVVRPTA